LKLLPSLIAILAVGILGYLCVGKDLISGGRSHTAQLDPASIDQAEFYRTTVDSVNSVRTAAAFPNTADRPLQDWLTASTTDAYRNGALATESLLEKLSTDLPQISSATACVAYGTDAGSIQNSIADWASSLDPSFNYFATHIFIDEAVQQFGCAAVAVEKLRRFSPHLVNEGEKAFYSICRLCNKSHIGSVEQTHGAAALTCPHCDRPYELLSFKLDGKVCRANELLTGWTPPVRLPKAKSKLHEMFQIWSAVLKRVRYSKDLEGSTGNLDTWQLSFETWNYKNGDCEDSSILLTDWLIARGFDARVVIGTTGDGEGHAWCVVRLNGTAYILETTRADPDINNPPYANGQQDNYIPRFQFNRSAIFCLNGETSRPRYWSTEHWLRLDAEKPPEEKL